MDEKIEEMAKDIPYLTLDREVFVGATEKRIVGWTLSEEDNKMIAKSLIEHGYRKITENEVVISKQEYEGLINQNKGLKEENHILRLENNDLEAEKDRLYEMKLDLENQLIQSGLTEYIGADEIEKQARKETAREILELLVPDCNSCDENWHNGCLCLRATLAEKIAKQFGIDLGEEQ